MNRLATWLTTRRGRFAGTMDFVHSLLLMAEEAGTMGFIRDHAQLRWYPPGSYVIEQGEVSTELFMISSGRADVWQEQADGSRKQLRRIGPGEFFGELGVAGILSERTEQPLLRAADGLLADQNWRANGGYACGDKGLRSSATGVAQAPIASLTGCSACIFIHRSRARGCAGHAAFSARVSQYGWSHSPVSRSFIPRTPVVIAASLA
jgi:hypothetical protein